MGFLECAECQEVGSADDEICCDDHLHRHLLQAKRTFVSINPM
jgi:hypothetical protein